MSNNKIKNESLPLATARVKAHLINSLAGEFYAARQAANLSEADLAARMGSTQARVRSIERAEGNLTIEEISHMAAALGLRIELRVRPAAKVSFPAIAAETSAEPPV